VRQVLIYCTDYTCGHYNIVSDNADRRPDELHISDIEDRFVGPCVVSAALTSDRISVRNGSRGCDTPKAFSVGAELLSVRAL
jgi:hypothetical protein